MHQRDRLSDLNLPRRDHTAAIGVIRHSGGAHFSLHRVSDIPRRVRYVKAEQCRWRVDRYAWHRKLFMRPKQIRGCRRAAGKLNLDHVAGVRLQRSKGLNANKIGRRNDGNDDVLIR
jgi:hypothetical protein